MLLGPLIILSMLRCLRSFDLLGIIFYFPVDHHYCTQAIIIVVLSNIAFNHSIFLDLSSIFLFIITAVLKPSSLLYLPSMTSICCLLNIFQQGLCFLVMRCSNMEFCHFDVGTRYLLRQTPHPLTGSIKNTLLLSQSGSLDSLGNHCENMTQSTGPFFSLSQPLHAPVTFPDLNIGVWGLSFLLSRVTVLSIPDHRWEQFVDVPLFLSPSYLCCWST
jgi:hypothetical protein